MAPPHLGGERRARRSVTKLLPGTAGRDGIDEPANTGGAAKIWGRIGAIFGQIHADLRVVVGWKTRRNRRKFALNRVRHLSAIVGSSRSQVLKVRSKTGSYAKNRHLGRSEITGHIPARAHKLLIYRKNPTYLK